jgi:hypothetical protein
MTIWPRIQSMGRQLKLRIVVEGPPSGVDYALQKGSGSSYEIENGEPCIGIQPAQQLGDVLPNGTPRLGHGRKVGKSYISLHPTSRDRDLDRASAKMEVLDNIEWWVVGPFGLSTAFSHLTSGNAFACAKLGTCVNFCRICAEALRGMLSSGHGAPGVLR